MKRMNLGAFSSILVVTSLGLVCSASDGRPDAKTAAANAAEIKVGETKLAQAESVRPPRKPISAEDKKAVIALFKGIDPSKYRLEFNHGRESYGTKKIEMSDLKQVRKISNPGEESGWVILIVEDDGVMYILAATHGDQSQLEEVLGKEKTARLNQIMAKYAR